MKEEKTKSKRKLLYYIVLGISVLLLATATVLTVYFMTGGNESLETPPDNTDPVQPGGNEPDDTDDPNEPSDGEGIRFTAPLDYDELALEYDAIYTNGTTGWIYRHKAVDIAAAEGTEVCSMADGTIKEISLNEVTGNYVTVDHGDGLVTLYRYVEPVDGLKEGDKVQKGETIAKVAAAYGSEAADGAHLHLEIELNGESVDPVDYLEPVKDEK